MKRFLLYLALPLLPLFSLAADKKPGEAATIQSIEFKGKPAPGAKLTATIKVKLAAGYHTHSSKPSEPNFIPTALTVEAPAGVQVGKIVYPKGTSLKVAGLDKPLSVYDEHFEITVPLTLGERVALPLVVPATLRYQACQGAVCFPPQRLKLDLTLGTLGTGP